MVRTILDQIKETIDNSPDGTIPLTRETRRFIRRQGIVRKMARDVDPNASRDSMIALAQEFRLSPMQAKSLFKKLHNLKASYSFGTELERIARAGSYVNKLETIRNSLSMLSKFSKQVLDEPEETAGNVESHLVDAVQLWAHDKRREYQQTGEAGKWEQVASNHGFVHRADSSQGYIVNTYNSETVVRTWLRNNVLFAQLVSEIIEKEYRKTKKPEPGKPSSHREYSVAELIKRSDEPSEIVSLAGIKLPRLYEECTNQSYGFSTGKTGGRRYAKGPKFVTMCLQVMGVKAPGVETLRTHWNKAKRWGGEQS